MNAKQMEEFAAKVANDIAEEIDCRETRAQLREVITWWALKSSDEAMAKASAQNDAQIAQLALSFAMPFVRRSRSKKAQFVRRMAQIALRK